MTDLELLITGAMVTFIAISGAYVAIRHRANEAPVQSYIPGHDAEPDPAAIRPQSDTR